MINSLVSFKYRDDLYVKECCICMVEFDPENNLIELPCNSKLSFLFKFRFIFFLRHIFHDNCVKQWLTINGGCPICRSKLIQNEQDE